MLFRNGLRLFMENFKNVYKILLYKFIVTFVAAALYSAFLLPQVVEIIESAEMSGVIASVKEFLLALLDGKADALHALKDGIQDSIKDLFAFISSKTLSLVLSVLACGVVYLLTRFADTLCYFSIGEMLGDKMETYAETPFFSSYVKNLGRGSVYSACYVPVVFLFDVLTWAFCYFLFFYLLSFLNLFISLFLSVTCIVLANALKLTLTSTWLPSMTADEYSVKRAVKSWGLVDKKLRGGIFSTYLISIYIVVIINVIGAIATMGSALIITLPSSYFFFICLQYVNYYTLTGKKYFLTHEKIVTNELHGDESLAVEFIAQSAAEENLDTEETVTKE